VTAKNLQQHPVQQSSSQKYEAIDASGAQAVQNAQSAPMDTETLTAQLSVEQNFGLAVVGGLAAMVVGAAVWASLTLATGFQIGWMAVGVGFLVGGAIRLIGKGATKPFGCLGAALSLFGCLLGNLLSLCAVVGREEGMSLSLVLLNLDLAAIPGAMVATFAPMDLLFYGIAIGEGYRLSLRRAPVSDLAQITTELPAV